MKLLSDWKDVLLYAWSIRLIILAGVLSGIELILPLFSNSFPTLYFGIASFIVTVAAVIARLTAQKNLDETTKHRK